MIVERFGDSYSTAYTFPKNKAVDRWGSTRPPLTTLVSGANGAFSFTGVNPYPIAPLTITKSFSLIAATSAAIDDARDSLIAATIAQPQGTLWLLDRDGTTTYRAYAQCVGVTAAESYQEGGKWVKDAEVSFQLNEGIFYSGATVVSDIQDHGTINTAQDTGFGGVQSDGKLFSPLVFTFSVSAGPGHISQIIFTTWFTQSPQITWQWDGVLAAGESLVVDAANYTVTRANVDHYDEFTPPNNSVMWAIIAPTIWPSTLDQYRVQYTPTGGNVTFSYKAEYVKRFIL